MLTQEQLTERRNYIGASEAAAVLGLSRWSTPIRVWAEKTGQIEPEDRSGDLAIEVGNDLEDLVCRLFTKRTGKEVRRARETIIHPKHPFIGANIDRMVVGDDSILEAKTASGWKAKEWQGEEIPSEYILQVLHQLAVTGKKRGYIACLIGGNQKFVWRAIERDEKLISEIIAKEVDFWTRFVEPKVMPVTITKDDSDILLQLFPDGQEGEPIQLDDEANRLADSLEALKADYRTLEGTIEKCENGLRALLKDNAVGVTDRFKITWKNRTTRRLDMERFKKEKPEVYEHYAQPKQSRVLRVDELKKSEE